VGASFADSLIVLACLLFFLGFYIFGIAGAYRFSPVLVDDALTYHIPAAAQWLSTGRLGLFTTWFFNPANTYSPLAGSTFIAWLIGAVGCDVLVQFVQGQALVMMFFGIIELCRGLEVRLRIAAVVALAAVVSRPLLSQSFEVKDDLFAAAFFLAAVDGCSARKLADRLGRWRVGVAIGMFAATKYTALLSAPLLLLLIDSPFRARWSIRSWLIAAACAALLAGPWYLRNWIVAGNPLYPVPFAGFPGLFVTVGSTELSTWRGVWLSLTDTPPAPGMEGKFHSPSASLLIALVIGWIIAAALIVSRRGPRAFFTDPLLRTALLSPPVGFVIFIIASHAGEIRYLYPSLLLLFTCCGIALDPKLLTKTGSIFVALLLAALAAWGSFNNKPFVGWFSLYGVLTAAIGIVAIYLVWPLLRQNRRAKLAVTGALVLIISGMVYVYWPGFLTVARMNFADPNVTRMKGPRAEMWSWIDEHIPADARVAYTNEFMIRPMLGFDYRRTVFYAPTRPGVHAYHDLPASRTKLTDQQIRAWCAEQLTKDADRETWMKNLSAGKPKYLVIGKQDVLETPPEKTWADSDSSQFRQVFSNDAGSIYQIIGAL
jgi:hypothetical protein